MKRNAFENIRSWFEMGCLKPLWIHGAPETGKTYLAIEFAKEFFEGRIYINFSENAVMRTKAEEYFSKKSDITGFVSYAYGIPEEYLKGQVLILDGFDDTEKLKELIPGSAAESRKNPLILISCFYDPAKYPSVFDPVAIYPMTFDEYLVACGKEWYVEVIRGHFQEMKKIPGIIHSELKGLFDTYLETGGFPRVIQESMNITLNEGLLTTLRKIQKVLYDAAGSLPDEETAYKAVKLFESVPMQHLCDNTKFMFTRIRKGVTYEYFKKALEYLTKTNIVYRLNRAKPDDDMNGMTVSDKNFRLFMADHGLLNAFYKSNINRESVYDEEEMEEINPFGKQLLSECFMMHMLALGKTMYYWESGMGSCVDFIEQRDDKLIPYELKLTENGRSKSLNIFIKKYDIDEAYRLTMGNFDSKTGIREIPMYSMFCL